MPPMVMGQSAAGDGAPPDPPRPPKSPVPSKKPKKSKKKKKAKNKGNEKPADDDNEEPSPTGPQPTLRTVSAPIERFVGPQHMLAERLLEEVASETLRELLSQAERPLQQEDLQNRFIQSIPGLFREDLEARLENPDDVLHVTESLREEFEGRLSNPNSRLSRILRDLLNEARNNSPVNQPGPSTPSGPVLGTFHHPPNRSIYPIQSFEPNRSRSRNHGVDGTHDRRIRSTDPVSEGDNRHESVFSSSQESAMSSGDTTVSAVEEYSGDYFSRSGRSHPSGPQRPATSSGIQSEVSGVSSPRSRVPAAARGSQSSHNRGRGRGAALSSRHLHRGRIRSSREDAQSIIHQTLAERPPLDQNLANAEESITSLQNMLTQHEQFAEMLRLRLQYLESRRAANGFVDGAADPTESMSIHEGSIRNAGGRRPASTQSNQNSANRVSSTATPPRERVPNANDLGGRLRQASRERASRLPSRLEEMGQNFEHPGSPSQRAEDFEVPDDLGVPGVPRRMLNTIPSIPQRSIQEESIQEMLLARMQRIMARSMERTQRELQNGLPASRQRARQTDEPPALVHGSNQLDEDAVPTVAGFVSDVESSPRLPPRLPPSSWTNGGPLQSSMPSSDDMNDRPIPAYRTPIGMFYPLPRQSATDGWDPPSTGPAESPSSWTNGRPLDSSTVESDSIDASQFSSNRAPTSASSRGQGQSSTESGEVSYLWAIAHPHQSFDGDAPEQSGASSEKEDVARQSRGTISNAILGSNTPVQGSMQLVSSATNHAQLLENVSLLTIISFRGEGEVTIMGGGESYRPGGGEPYRPSARPRSPHRIDSFRGGRDRDRSPRRERARTPPTDSWHPSSRDRSPRRRSRTPPRRDRSPVRDNWRARPRSPIRARTPPRRFSPRRDDDRRARSPARRDERRRSRSPYDRDRPVPRARSPLSRRSPPAGPRASYRGRSRSPERRDERAPTGPSSSNWRRRSPSPARDSERSSERTSGNTSRRSSPPIHPERLHLTQTATRDSRPRSPPTRDRSPPTQLAYKDRDSARLTPRERSPVRPVAQRSPPRGPAGFRAPTGPSGGRNFTAPSPSASSHTAVSTSAHSRPENAGPVIPPSGPRGYVPPARGAYSIRGGRGGFGSDRISRPDTSSWGAAPPSRPAAEAPARGVTLTSRPAPSPSPSIPSGPAATVPTGPSGGIPTGPRAGVPSRPPLQHSSSVYNSRPNAAMSTNSGPRPHPAMANLPQIIPGGRLDPTASGIPSEIAARLKRKEEEAEILREELHAKQEKLRQGLKGWDKLSRDSQSMGLRSELSERHVRMLAGEGVGGAAF